MATQIINNGASLKITSPSGTRTILKQQIREINLLGGTTVKIDIGQGALNNVFIVHADVTSPVTATPADLVDAINAMLATSTDGNATEAKQDSEITELQNIKTRMDNLLGKVDTLNDRVFIEPLLVDEGTPGIIYKGYAIPGSAVNAAVWAIEKITLAGEVTTKTWAGGNKTFDKIWNNRSTLVYS